MYAKLLLALKTGIKENIAKRATNAQMTLSPFKLVINSFIMNMFWVASFVFRVQA
jgi:hypothetical protein